MPLQLAGLGERLLTGTTLEHSRLLGAQRRAGLMRLRVLLPQSTHGEKPEVTAALDGLRHGRGDPSEQQGQPEARLG